MGTPVDVTISVDSDVKTMTDALVAECVDIKNKASTFTQGTDLLKNLFPILGSIGEIPAEIKASQENRQYLLMGLDQMAETLMGISPSAPAAPST